ncbi:MAG: hypothetical protein Q7U82_06890 [Gammaproteobacteria bacterium]|nr:hypothetical protein [Gammaproteobacteria bacterium]
MRVQRKLRTDAENRLSALAEVVESTEGIDPFLNNISADWRSYVDIGEGLYEPELGSFNPDAAKYSLDDIKSGISGLAGDLRTLSTMMLASVESDRKAVSLSLSVSYGGLVLIVLGFLLQMLAYL